MFQVVIALLCVLSYFIYKFIKSKRNYWPKRGVVYDQNSHILGVSWDFLVGSKTLFELTRDIYNQFPDAPVVGTFSFFTPTLVLRNPKNIEEVVTGDYKTFNSRGFEFDGNVDKLTDNLPFMEGVRWKLTRQKMSPLFTVAKLRNMYYIMEKSGKDFVDYLQSQPKENAFDTLSTFCSASIAASVFGISTKSVMDSPFLYMAREALKPSLSLTLKVSLATMCPKLLSVLRLKLFGKFEKFFIGAIKEVLREREKQTTKTHDFAELCVELQRKGTLRDPTTGYEIEPTDEIMAAQAFFFFIAGVEPSATAMFFALFELAKHPDVLKKLQDEVDDVFKQWDGNPTYEAVIDMKYMDMVLDESMRIHPAIGNIFRSCTQDGGMLPVGNLKVDKGTLIHIPVYAIHHDPKYYPEPQKFIPERFSEEGKAKIKNYTYMPFGDGHRMCLGMRLARLQVKTGLLYLLRHFTVETRDANTPMKYAKLPGQVRPLNIDLQFVPRTKTN